MPSNSKKSLELKKTNGFVYFGKQSLPTGTHEKLRTLILSKYITSCHLHERKLFKTPLSRLAHPCVKKMEYKNVAGL